MLYQLSYFRNLRNSGAENETRTRDPDLGKVVLYQLSYFRLSSTIGNPFSLDSLFCFALQKYNFFQLRKHF